MAERWQHQGSRVSVLTRTEQKAARLSAAGLEPLIGDLATGHLPSLPDVDTVLWSVGFDRSAGCSREQIWIDGLRSLARQLPKTVRRFLYVSSTGVYGQTDGKIVSESTPPQPATDSGRCCLQAEQLLQEMNSSGAAPGTLSILRMAGLYGPNRLLRRTSDLRRGVPLPGHPDHWLNLIHIDDAVTAVVDLPTATDIPLLNVVNTGTLTREQYYRELARLVDAPEPVFDSSVSTMRGGNKRVVSDRRSSLQLEFRFDDVRAGLRHAVENTTAADSDHLNQ